MNIENILTVFGLFGFAGIFKSFFDFLIQKNKVKFDAKQETKEKRYKTIILLCYSLANFERESDNLVINRPSITSIEKLKNELYTEFVNMSLYASDEVIFKMKSFIINFNSKTLNELVLAMRKDLYGISTKLKGDTFDI